MIAEFLEDLIVAAWLGQSPDGEWTNREWQEARIALFLGFFVGIS